jgi:DNA polymerase-3 subunit alpha
LEGIARHAGTHAAGIVISADPLVEHVALQRPARGGDATSLPTTQFSMENVASIGLLKMDFLGLANLTILGEAVDIVKQNRGELLDVKAFPDGDENTYAMLAKGETFGVFQLESAGMRRAIQDLRPGSIAELAAMVALYRPGPMQHIPTFCRAKHGEAEIRYPHPDLAGILDETYGVIVYQDQVLLIARQFAGYTLGEADIMRKAMGKKIPEKMRAERERFMRGAAELGYGEDDAQTIFDLIEPFAGYAFNKAHAVCYGTISYQTAYLKANYPAEYMTAVLRLAPSHPSGTFERVAAAVAECLKLGIPVLRPDINRSGVQFDVEAQEDSRLAIRFGLSIIKNVGEAAVQAICDARAQQPDGLFRSLEDVCMAVDHSQIKKRVMESLIKSGALDELGERAAMLDRLDQAMASAHAHQRAVQRGQMDLFGTASVELALPGSGDAHAVAPIPRKTVLLWEKEHLGTYLSDHPLTEVMRHAQASGVAIQPIAAIDAEMVGQPVRLLGIISGVRKMTTRTNRTMAVVRFEDLSGSVEVVLFPDAYERSNGLIADDAIVSIRGKVDPRNDSFQVIGDEVTHYEMTGPPQSPNYQIVRIEIAASSARDALVDAMRRLATLLREFQGDDMVRVVLHMPNRTLELESRMRVDWCDDLRRAVEETTIVSSTSVSPAHHERSTR